MVHARALDLQALLDDLADRQARRQRAVGILEDDLHLLAQGSHALANRRPSMRVPTIGDRPLRGDEAQKRQAERGLARAGFADHAQRLARAHAQRDAVDGLDVVDRAAQQAALDREPDLEIVRLQHDRRAGVGLGGSPFGSAERRWRV